MAAQEMAKKYPLKVMNIGMFRGGTTSLSLALQELGYGQTWHLVTNSPELTKKGSKWWLENHIVDRFLNGDANVNFDEWLNIIKCDVIMDTPVVHTWEEIFRQYPDCKVILCIRDFESWCKSYINLLKECTAPSMRICTMTDEFTKEINELWDKTHIGTDYKGLKELLALDQLRQREVLRTEYYDKQINRAKEIVPKDQLLIYNPNEGWKALCKFLDKPIPNKPFPRTNSTKELNQFMYEWKKSAFKTFIWGKMCNSYFVSAFIMIIICIIILAKDF